MKEFEEVLQSSSVDKKQKFIDKSLDMLKANQDIENSYQAVEFKEPSYASFCTIVNPRELPSRKDFDTNEGLASLIHAIVHIEYSAIDLALDAVYRFQDMPIEYKIDWLVVADDEIRHFRMLDEILNSLGFKYGDFSVHCGLFDASNHTKDSVLERMAIIPRYYEASGLDVNPQIIKKLDNRRKNRTIAKVIEALNIIYEEEISHVYKGDKWFKYLCEIQGLDSQKTYIDILQKYKLDKKHRPHINVEARKEAGFSCDELLSLGARKCE